MTAHRLSRRQALAGLGTVSLTGLLAACGDDDAPSRADVTTTTPTTATVEPRATTAASELFGDASACTLAAEQTEGPFYFDVDSIRGDIREDREGTPLRLAIRVRDANGCRPLRNAVVDIWHCDAAGVYSGFDAGADETFLRGAQVTDANGIVEFATVYPGRYTGRTVHVHAKVHVDRTTVLTTQLYFDDAVSDRVHARAPYASGSGGDARNATDGIFDERLLLDLSKESDGWLGAISLDVRRA